MSMIVRCQNCLYKQDIKDNQEITGLGIKYYYTDYCDICESEFKSKIKEILVEFLKIPDVIFDIAFSFILKNINFDNYYYFLRNVDAKTIFNSPISGFGRGYNSFDSRERTSINIIHNIMYPGNIAGMLLPLGILLDIRYKYIRKILLQQNNIMYIINLSDGGFYTRTRVHMIFLIYTKRGVTTNIQVFNQNKEFVKNINIRDIENYVIAV